MTDRKLFGVAVRVVGLWLAAYQGLVDLFAAIATAADQRMTNGYSAEHRLLVGVFTLIMGVALLKGEWLVRFAYGSEPRTEQNSN
jgi:hypothetical protein